MNETPASILSWARENFGEPNVLATLIRGNIEMAELISAIYCGADRDMVALELADVDIVCSQAAEILDVEVDIIREVTPPNGVGLTDLALIANSALSDLMSNVSHGRINEDAQNCIIDLYWALRLMAQYLDVDMQERRNEKMKINRARKWGKTPEGHYQHL